MVKYSLGKICCTSIYPHLLRSLNPSSIPYIHRFTNPSRSNYFEDPQENFFHFHFFQKGDLKDDSVILLS